MGKLGTSTLALLSAGLVILGGMAGAEPVTPERLLAAGTEAEKGNWLTVHGSYNAHRFSLLNEINAGNVSGLKLAFAVPLGGLEPSAFGTGAMEGTPLYNDGALYVSDGWGTPYKIDVSSGKMGQVAWVGETGVEKDPSWGILAVNRGLALWNNLVITNTPNGHVIAYDDATGAVVWDMAVATDPGEGFTGAPLALGDKIIVGQSYGDWATRGWIAALDAATGAEKWRFYTVPAPGEPGSETWLCDQTGNPDCWKTGGAAAWVTGSYDPESNTLYYGTGNPVPSYDPEYRPGDNLYSNSLLALDAGTGALKWYFQYTPGDYLDYDEVGVHILIDREINGEMRKVVSHFGRNGFFYSFDRTNGSFIAGAPYVNKVNWTPGLDPKTGLPLTYDPNKDLQVYDQTVLLRRGGGEIENCPHLQGGVNFWPTGYNPVTGLAYGHPIEGCSALTTVVVAPEDVKPGTVFTGGSNKNSGAIDGSIVGMDPATGKQSVKVMLEYPGYAGVMLTTDLVWVAELDGTFGAYDATTLEQKWSINVGSVFKAPAITFAINGKQYVAVLGGSIGLASFAFGHPELELKQNANMLWVFTL